MFPSLLLYILVIFTSLSKYSLVVSFIFTLGLSIALITIGLKLLGLGNYSVSLIYKFLLCLTIDTVHIKHMTIAVITITGTMIKTVTHNQKCILFNYRMYLCRLLFF